MQVLLILCLNWLAFSSAVNVDPEKLMRKAEESIQNDVLQRMKLGETSKRFAPKKITPLYDIIRPTYHE